MKAPWSIKFEALLPAIQNQGYSWQCVSLWEWVALWFTKHKVRVN